MMTLPPQGRDKEPPQRQLLDACFHDDQGTYVWLEQLHSVEELLLTGAVLPHDAPPNRAQVEACLPLPCLQGGSKEDKGQHPSGTF